MNTDDPANLVSPRAVLEQVARAVPADCRENIIVIGSLAAGYHFFGNDASIMIRTKDVDCLLAPRVRILSAGKVVTERLFRDGWRYRPDAMRPTPGDASTPEKDLPAVRLHPPDSRDWFIELLAVPESPADRKPHWSRLVTSAGHFGLCSFGFLALSEYRPIRTGSGIAVARPEMMALSNLLEHPLIGVQTMSATIGGRVLKRSNKDLGRVLAIARLSADDVVERWPDRWAKALEKQFGGEWRELAGRAGNGLRQLLAGNNAPDLEEARHSCEFGLLTSRPPDLKELQATGLRLLQDAVEPLERMAKS